MYRDVMANRRLPAGATSCYQCMSVFCAVQKIVSSAYLVVLVNLGSMHHDNISMSQWELQDMVLVTEFIIANSPDFRLLFGSEAHNRW